MKRFLVVLAVLTAVPPVISSAAVADVKVTDQATYVRHDGGSDPVIVACGSDATTPTPGGDDGGEQAQNEPAVAVRPGEPTFVVASSNDGCIGVNLNVAWQGIYVSTDGGASWTDSLLPGYPGDTSADGAASPLMRSHESISGDPVLDWDNDGHLFAGGISYNQTEANPSGFVTPTNGHVYVARYTRSIAAPLGIDFDQTVIVGEGTPGQFPFAGRFHDKPSLKVDDWASSPFEGNVYSSWTLFPAFGIGQDQILFSRSSDAGLTFSKPIKISKAVASAQGSDIVVRPNGDVYVFWREFDQSLPAVNDEIVFAISTDGGKHFSDPRTLAAIVPYGSRDVYVSGGSARECGDGPFLCVSRFVFSRNGTLPQGTADDNGNLYVTWEELTPAADNGDSYRPDGQSHIVVAKSTNAGSSWTKAVADPQSVGHQFWPNIEYNKATDKLGIVYYDSRADPFYSAFRPIGNQANPPGGSGLSSCGVPPPSVCNVLNTFIATSSDGVSWTPTLVSTVGHQPQYELVAARDMPFHGDYLWIDAKATTFFGVWTDNRDVVPGPDPREAVQDGFDVLQCLEANPDGTFSSDNCRNAGGHDQNIYGATP
jgi:hypothetical protein